MSINEQDHHHQQEQEQQQQEQEQQQQQDNVASSPPSLPPAAFDRYIEMNGKDRVSFSMVTAALKIEQLYKGTQRFLCEVVRTRELDIKRLEADEADVTSLKRRTKAMRDLLDRGWY